MPDRLSRWRVAHPLRFAAGCALAVAAIGMVPDGASAGAGYAQPRAMLEGQAELPAFFTPQKLRATRLSACTSVPAGVFAPSMTIGASIGPNVALLTGRRGRGRDPPIALGMLGFLAATTQGPITAFIIAMEMVAGQAMVLSLMACALLAGGVARLLTRPMSEELAAMLPLPAATPQAPTRS